MPQFNLDEYELVEDRIRAFYADYPDGRIVTHELTTSADREKGIFIVRAEVFTGHEDQHADCPKATGLAFEIQGTAGANKTAALENAETSAIGRALANADYAKGKRPSRQEMEKASRGPQATSQPEIPDGFLDKVKSAKDEVELHLLWDEAVASGFSNSVVRPINAAKKKLEVK